MRKKQENKKVNIYKEEESYLEKMTDRAEFLWKFLLSAENKQDVYRIRIVFFSIIRYT